jgi:hypothetical protein
MCGCHSVWVVMARRVADGVTLLWWPSGGVSSLVWVVTVRAAVCLCQAAASPAVPSAGAGGAVLPAAVVSGWLDASLLACVQEPSA